MNYKTYNNRINVYILFVKTSVHMLKILNLKYSIFPNIYEYTL